MNAWLNIDLGELPDEPEALYRSAHGASVACGGHAGDAASMALAAALCARHGVRAGAHPSYPDRANFGRAPMALAPSALRAAVAEQCDALVEAAARAGIALVHVKPHGALYHAAARAPALADAVVAGAVESLGYEITVVGPAGSALAQAAARAGLAFAREGFADRAMRPDGSLVPRGEPGAVITDPTRAAAQARALVLAGAVDTVCVHGDSPNAAAVAQAVRAALDALAVDPGVRAVILPGAPLEPLGEGALRVALAPGADGAVVLSALRAMPRVRDAVVTETHAALYFDPTRPPRDPRPRLARLAPAEPARASVLHLVRARYDGEDLPAVAAVLGLREAAVVDCHAAREYVVRYVGFLPGFAYLGELDPRLVLPRRASPRPRVPAGAVGIAGTRTGIYPFASPGGWHLIARAEGFGAFDPARGATLRAGDRVRFEPVP